MKHLMVKEAHVLCWTQSASQVEEVEEKNMSQLEEYTLFEEVLTAVLKSLLELFIDP